MHASRRHAGDIQACDRQDTKLNTRTKHAEGTLKVTEGKPYQLREAVI